MNIHRHHAAERLILAACLTLSFSLPANAGNGVVAVGISSDGDLAVSTTESAVRLGAVPGVIAVESDGVEDLLAVGPASVHNLLDQSWLVVLDRPIAIDSATAFPSGQVANGEYIAVTGVMNGDGIATAGNVVRLGGRYSPAISPVYVRGLIEVMGPDGTALVSGSAVDLSQAFVDPLLSQSEGSVIVEIVGIQDLASSKVVAFSASALSGITGSGARGITGSGARGITGSGARGITGSGARGITGSGARGITGSGARGITGSGARGITGSGARGITGSGARGITGSGARGITGSGARNLDQNDRV